jgi:hypothetical protein
VRSGTAAVTSLLTRVATSTATLVLGVTLSAQETRRPAPPPFMMQAPLGAESGGRVVKGAPFSAQTVTESTEALADGKRIVQRSNGAVYRDRDGRTRHEHRATDAGRLMRGGQTITIDDVVAGVHYVLDPEAKTAQRMPRWNGRPQPDRVPGQPANRIGATSSDEGRPAPARESLGTKTIEGLESEGTRTTVIVPAGDAGNQIPIEIVTERWVSRELQVPVLMRLADPRVGERVYRLTGISRGEPPAQLFVVPPEFTVVDGPERLMRRKHVP